MQIRNLSSLKEKRRKLRKSMTEAERLIWSKLRNNQTGYRFLRQYGVGQYILDFYCPKLKLAIEIDGQYHEKTDVAQYDKTRDEYLQSLGIKVRHISNTIILSDIDKALLLPFN